MPRPRWVFLNSLHMCSLRTWLAFLLMVLVPLQGAAAAAKLCCLSRGHSLPASLVSVQGQVTNAHHAKDGGTENSAVRNIAKHGEGVTTGEECAVCVTLCHSAGMPQAAHAQKQLHFSDATPSYLGWAFGHRVQAVPDKPPRG